MTIIKKFRILIDDLNNYLKNMIIKKIINFRNIHVY